ncbi:nuclear transport factor 2 family protein [Gordonia sp. HY285]|uniref:nuclear transport factor 2 family protein n=1 Tax=Gordonia liuliyuniae TaxID=2911517 RepID=UPI001F235311|nr:nuclear transport factor 2 family protein [Gordonia liuliyuniae]MCF8610542.1 nuclear transport factor 2 family protein [Gordonia liuliyuniae]
MTLLETVREIEHLKYRYLRAVDTKDWDGLSATLTEDVHTDYGTKMGGQELSFTDRKSVIEYLSRAMSGSILTEHRVDHPIINVDGETATGSWYLQDRVMVPEFDTLIIGAAFYADEYRLTQDGWRISRTGYERTFEAVGSLSAGGWQVHPGPALT